MPRASLTDMAQYHTLPEVAHALGMDEQKVARWIEAGILPAATTTRDTGVKLFDDSWLRTARKSARAFQKSRAG